MLTISFEIRAGGREKASETLTKLLAPVAKNYFPCREHLIRIRRNVFCTSADSNKVQENESKFPVAKRKELKKY